MDRCSNPAPLRSLPPLLAVLHAAIFFDSAIDMKTLDGRTRRLQREIRRRCKTTHGVVLHGHGMWTKDGEDVRSREGRSPARSSQTSPRCAFARVYTISSIPVAFFGASLPDWPSPLSIKIAFPPWWLRPRARAVLLKVTRHYSPTK